MEKNTIDIICIGNVDLSLVIDFTFTVLSPNKEIEF